MSDQAEKKLYILRGISGSGKSYLANQIIEKEGGGQIFSADDYFINKNTGKYEYKADKIANAHTWSQNRAWDAMEKGVTPIIIDNTNTKCWEAKPYVEEGLKNGYKVEIQEPTTPWAKNAEELFNRNQHGVPLESIMSMLNRWDDDFTVQSIMKTKSKFKKRDNNKRQKLNQQTITVKTADGEEIRFMSGYVGLFGTKTEELCNDNPTDLVPKDYIVQREKRDGPEHHLTIFFVNEFKTAQNNLEKAYVEEVKDLKTNKKYNNDQESKIQLWMDVLSKVITCDWKNFGVGKVVQGSDETMFQVIDWPSANECRQKLGLGKKDFHLSLGFKARDLHNVPKNVSTLVWNKE
ncbi:hypothetical protein AKO1_007833 [Acrasis kona]|uniref:Swiss Army Knife 2H phosphoesterase domain-containing protein n=1 Tax=Acrasis kona TaxID=1008807 RepID=A0AAW2YQ26_9EUKA